MRDSLGATSLFYSGLGQPQVSLFAQVSCVLWNTFGCNVIGKFGSVIIGECPIQDVPTVYSPLFVARRSDINPNYYRISNTNVCFEAHGAVLKVPLSGANLWDDA